MKLLALEIPDDTSAQAKWLEEQIVSMDLGDLVAQLLVGNVANLEASLDDLLGDRLPEAVNSGLGSFSGEQLQALLSHPRLLLDLQERIFVEGGSYWSSVAISEDHQASAKRVTDASLHGTAESTSIALGQHTKNRRYAVFALAACLLVGFGIWSLRTPPPTGWGFDRSGLLSQKIPAPEYLETLAGAANDWFNKRPADSEQLKKRLQTFREGCDTLLAAAHPQLSAEDKAWLQDRCRAWRDKIDLQLARLDSNEATFSDASQSADTLVRQMVSKLRERAQIVADSLG